MTILVRKYSSARHRLMGATSTRECLALARLYRRYKSPRPLTQASTVAAGAPDKDAVVVVTAYGGRRPLVSTRHMITFDSSVRRLMVSFAVSLCLPFYRLPSGKPESVRFEAVHGKLPSKGRVDLHSFRAHIAEVLVVK